MTKQQQYIYVHIYKLDYLIMGMIFYFYLQGIQYDTVFAFLYILTLGTELKKISFSNEEEPHFIFDVTTLLCASSSHQEP